LDAFPQLLSWYDAAVNRSFDAEIVDDPALSEEIHVRSHDCLTRTHQWLGNTRAIVSALRRDPLPVRRVLDVGCGRGGLLVEVRRQIGAEILGVDLRPPRPPINAVPILRADAVHEPLPVSDVALAVCLAHHLKDTELIELIRNVGRSCRRFVILDLVRHYLPLTLFEAFVAPFLYHVNARDGRVSIRRSYTPAELNALVRRALEGSRAVFRHSVAPLYTRQMVDIRW
jgi:SAM-dependent methyltransferase